MCIGFSDDSEKWFLGMLNDIKAKVAMAKMGLDLRH